MNNRKLFIPVLLLFVIINFLIYALRSRLESWGFDLNVLVFGNLFLFVLSFFAFVLHRKAVNATRTPEFFRYFYIAFLLKFFLTIAAVVIYAVSAEKVNKLSIGTCMGLYLLYTFIETRLLLKAGKQKNA